MASDESPVDAVAMTTGHQPSDPMNSAETIANGLDERRDAPRFPLREYCTVLSGTQIQRAFIRDVSISGAMLHGVRNVTVGHLLRLRLDRMPDQSIPARVRGISVLGVHLSIEGAIEKELWQEALRDVLA